MLLSTQSLDDLATALEYPRSDTAEAARRAGEELGGDSGRCLSELAAQLSSAPIGEAEERYTRLYDLKPVCTLNLAWHVFGDTYDRGALLANLAGELDAHGVAHRHDLPDYLPTLLRLLGRLEDEEERRLLVHAVMLPGLDKVADKLAPSTDAWSKLICSLPTLLRDEVPQGDVEIPAPRRRSLEVLPC